MEVERIHWTDSGQHMDHGWAKATVFAQSAMNWDGAVVTVGQVIHEDEDVLVVGLSHDVSNDTWYGAQLIYKPCITKRETL